MTYLPNFRHLSCLETDKIKVICHKTKKLVRNIVFSICDRRLRTNHKRCDSQILHACWWRHKWPTYQISDLYLVYRQRYTHERKSIFRAIFRYFPIRYRKIWCDRVWSPWTQLSNGTNHLKKFQPQAEIWIFESKIPIFTKIATRTPSGSSVTSQWRHRAK